mgnify:CR=1 FL=1
MKKNNSSGFVLAETLIVTTFVAGVLVFLFIPNKYTKNIFVSLFFDINSNSEGEAYTATKQAVYCYLYNRGTEGIRTEDSWGRGAYLCA